jgi:cobalt/nickel transport system permease protein
MAGRMPTLAAALAVAGATAAMSGLGLGRTLRRLVPLNAFLLLVFLVVPLSVPGELWVSVGPLIATRQGLRLASAIVLKGNAIVLALAALLGTLDLATLGHALHHLRMPDKLVHLLLFTVRYVAVLERERGRLGTALKLRGFRPRMDRHTWRTYGYLVGMLLVRSLDRSERIVAAMKCRGFCGRFHLLDHFAWARRDTAFAALVAAVLALLAIGEWP